jgi:hypothetical protein
MFDRQAFPESAIVIKAVIGRLAKAATPEVAMRNCRRDVPAPQAARRDFMKSGRFISAYRFFIGGRVHHFISDR